MLEVANLFFTAIFAAELSVNLYAHWLRAFLRNPWNMLDGAVVLMSLVALGPVYLPITILRLMRAFRVIRLFGRLKALKKMVSALSWSIVPMMNAFLILVIIASIYAIMGVSIFGSDAYVNFGKFEQAFVTMFRMTTEGSWPESVPSHGEDGRVIWPTAIFMMSYIVLVNWVVLQVSVAVLLDNFVSASAAIEEEEKRRKREESGRRQEAKSPLEPLLKKLSQVYVDEADLAEKLRRLYHMLDTDRSGGLDCDEFCASIKKLDFKPRIHMAPSDYLSLTRGGALCDADGQLRLEPFRLAMREQLRLYAQSQLCNPEQRSRMDAELSQIRALKWLLLDQQALRRDLLPFCAAAAAAAAAAADPTAASAAASGAAAAPSSGNGAAAAAAAAAAAGLAQLLRSGGGLSGLTGRSIWLPPPPPSTSASAIPSSAAAAASTRASRPPKASPFSWLSRVRSGGGGGVIPRGSTRPAERRSASHSQAAIAATEASPRAPPWAPSSPAAAPPPLPERRRSSVGPPGQGREPAAHSAATAGGAVAGCAAPRPRRRGGDGGGGGGGGGSGSSSSSSTRTRACGGGGRAAGGGGSDGDGGSRGGAGDGGSDGGESAGSGRDEEGGHAGREGEGATRGPAAPGPGPEGGGGPVRTAAAAAHDFPESAPPPPPADAAGTGSAAEWADGPAPGGSDAAQRWVVAARNQEPRAAPCAAGAADLVHVRRRPPHPPPPPRPESGGGLAALEAAVLELGPPPAVGPAAGSELARPRIATAGAAADAVLATADGATTSPSVARPGARVGAG